MREWLKTIRCNNKYTQQFVSDKIGISQQYYNLIENGERQKDLDLSLVLKLSNIFNVSVEWIIERENQINMEE